jgi:hypothetical protein
MQYNTVLSFDFSELSETAREYARDNYREYGLNDDWYSPLIEDWKEGLELLGIDVSNIFFSGFWSQGDGACFECFYSYRKGWRKALNSEFGGSLGGILLSAGERLQALQRPLFYRLIATVSQYGRYTHHYSTIFDVDPDGLLSDESAVAVEDELKGILRGLMREIYNSLEREYNYLSSDSVIDDYLQNDGHQFLESGKIYQ